MPNSDSLKKNICFLILHNSIKYSERIFKNNIYFMLVHTKSLTQQNNSELMSSFNIEKR